MFGVQKSCVFFALLFFCAVSLVAVLVILFVVPSTHVNSKDVIFVPVLQKSATFSYGAHTWNDRGEISSTWLRAVNVGKLVESPNCYTLAASTKQQAVENGVTKKFPFFGKINSKNLEVYENGKPQALFGTFPISVNSPTPSWKFTFLSREWTANVITVNANKSTISYSATSKSGETTLEYTLDARVGFLRYMKLKEKGYKTLEIALFKNEKLGYLGYGSAYLVRATDLFNQKWTSQDKAKANFEVAEPTNGEQWDVLISVLSVKVGCDAHNRASVRMIRNTPGKITSLRQIQPSAMLLLPTASIDQSFRQCDLTPGKVVVQQPPHAANYYNITVVAVGDDTIVQLRVAGAMVRKYQRSNFDKFIWVMVTAVTNFIFVPWVFHRDVLLKRHLIFETVVTAFTLSVSFLYHFCDSMDYRDLGRSSLFSNGVWLGESQWHRLDNVGAIMCFIILLIHFTNYKNIAYTQVNKFVALFLVLVCQQKSPWDLRFTVYPILCQVAILIFKFAYVDGFHIPKLNPYMFKRSIFWQSCAFFFFYLGLSERTDPYRMYHGLWHTFSGIATIYHWRVVVSHREDPLNVKERIV